MAIVLDAMGSDKYPDPEIEAAVKLVNSGFGSITLVGNEGIIRPKLSALRGDGLPIRIVHAPDVIEMGDKPVENSRTKSLNSMAVGCELIKSGEAQAFVTAGNTGAAMFNALRKLGRVKGVLRPALTTVFPTAKGRCVVLDIGANAECKPEFLLQFAIMGSLYSERVLGVANPKIGLLSIGEEPGKGNQLVKDVYPLLQASGLNFVGNVESKELFAGELDVVVTDGFSGNILLKTSESVGKLITTVLKDELKATPLTLIGGLLAKPAFAKLKKLLDPGEIGAAPLLGVDGLVFVGHGRSDSRAIINAVRLAQQAVDSGLLQAIRTTLPEKMASISRSETHPE